MDRTRSASSFIYLLYQESIVVIKYLLAYNENVFFETSSAVKWDRIAQDSKANSTARNSILG